MLNLYDGSWRYACRATGLMMPWYTMPALERLAEIIEPEMWVFEYGGGMSTAWYRAMVSMATGVESDYTYARAFGLRYAPDPHSYVSAVHAKKPKKYDLIVVDGMWRKECFEQAVKHRPKYIIADNWNQPSAYTDWGHSEELAIKAGYVMEVYQQEDHEDWKTAIFVYEDISDSQDV